MEPGDFEEFLVAIRSGNHEAAIEFVRQYEPYLRRVIHMRLADYQVRHIVDSVDICQSVMADFFAKARPNQFVFRSPDDVRRLVVTMALNKLRNWARHESKHRGDLPEDWDPAAGDPTPSGVVAANDEIAVLMDRLPPRESELFRKSRIEGLSWEEIAGQSGDRPDALRMRLMRALTRILVEWDDRGSGHGT